MLFGGGRRQLAVSPKRGRRVAFGLVEAGLGVAAVPSMAMPGADHPLLVSVPLVAPIITRKVGLIRRRGRSLSPAAQQLFDLFGQVKDRRRTRQVRVAR